MSENENRSARDAGKRQSKVLSSAPAIKPTTASEAGMSDTVVQRHGPTALPGQFGRYRVIKKLGGGGMGTVYLVFNTELEREEALKVPHFTDGDDQQVRERFLREAKSAARLDHTNICPVYDMGVLDGIYYLTMRYLKGKPLSDVLDTAYTVRKSVETIAKLAQALKSAHTRGVIHRDLKPSNIMMVGNSVPVIMDFGLAKQILQPSQELTQQGDTLGTPAYMPPEQVKGEVEQMGPASDIYSLGVILYQLLTGRLPFEGRTAGVIYGQILHTEPPVPSSFRPEVGEMLDGICQKAMSKDPADRYSSMKAFALALVECLRTLPATGGTLPAPGENSAVFQAATLAPGRRTEGPNDVFQAPTVSPRAKSPLSESLPKAPAPTLHRSTKSARKTVKKDQQPGNTSKNQSSLNFGLMVGAAIALLTIAIGAFLAVSVFRVRTAEGILVVEVNEPNPDVFVDGEKVTVAWKNGGVKAEIGTKSGTRKVELKKDGFRVYGQEVTLEDQGRTVLVAKLEPIPMPPPPPPPDDNKNPDQDHLPHDDVNHGDGLTGGIPIVGKPVSGIDPRLKRPKTDENAVRAADIDRGQSLRASVDPVEIAEIVGEVAPGFTAKVPVIPGGVALIAEHFGRKRVLSTHPLDGARPCVLASMIEVPAGMQTFLTFDVSHSAAGDWQVVVLGNGERLYEADVGPKSAIRGWQHVSVNLTRFAGKQVTLELHNQATGFSHEWAWWDKIRITAYTPGQSQADEIIGNPESELFVANGGNYAKDGSGSICKFTSTGTRSTFATGLNYPTALALDSSGNLFVVEQITYDILKFTSSGDRSTFASGLNIPTGMTFSSTGDLFVTDNGSGRIYKFSPNGSKSVFATGPKESQGLAFDANGNLFQAGWTNNSIYRYPPDGSQTVFASGLNKPHTLAFNSNGDLFVSDFGSGNIYKFTSSGSRSTFVTLSNDHPVGLAFDPNGNFFVGGSDTHSIYKFTANGSKTIFATGINPAGLAFARKVAAVSDANPPPLDCTGDNGVDPVHVRTSQELWAKYLGRNVEEKVMLGNGATIDFVLVPPGRFRMGSPENELGKGGRYHNETLHEVSLTQPVDISKFEVTQAQYLALTGQDPSLFKGADRPVEQVTWTDADAFGRQLTAKLADGSIYRLLSEAEWEYSCRGGRPVSLPFGVGDGRILTIRDANIDNSVRETSKVGSYPPNAFGLCDMHGNVWEWCADWNEIYPSGPVTNPLRTTGSQFRVARGGCHNEPPPECRAALRQGSPPDRRDCWMGFRIARSVPVVAASQSSTAPEVEDNLELESETRFVSLFDGETLKGWEGDPRYWAVSQGAIVGKTPVGHPEATFLTHEKEYDDFELSLKFQLLQGNSGVQFRSQQFPNYVMKGPQADIVENWWGSLFLLVVDNRESAAFSEPISKATRDKLSKVISPSEWIDLNVLAHGPSVRINVAGVETIHTTKPSIAITGLIGFELFSGGTTVMFKDIKVRRLSADDVPQTGIAKESETLNAPEQFSLESGGPLNRSVELYRKQVDRANSELLSEFQKVTKSLLRINGKKSVDLLQWSDLLASERKAFESQKRLPWSEPMRPYTAKYLKSLERAANLLQKELLIATEKQQSENNVEANPLRAQVVQLLAPHIVGRWGHQVGQGSIDDLKLLSNGRIGEPESDHRWTLDEKGRLLLFWRDSKAPMGAWVDTCQLSPDGKTYSGSNNNGLSITGNAASN